MARVPTKYDENSNANLFGNAPSTSVTIGTSNNQNVSIIRNNAALLNLQSTSTTLANENSVTIKSTAASGTAKSTIFEHNGVEMLKANTTTGDVGTLITGISNYESNMTSNSLTTKTYVDGRTIDNLSDVTITSATNKQALVYDSNTSQWKNTTLNVSSNHINDIVSTTPFHGNVLSYKTSSGKYENDSVVWIDLIGQVSTRSGGSANSPSVEQFDAAGLYYEHATLTGNNQITQMYFSYHLPHSYVLGSDLYIHLHNALITTDTTTSVFVVSAAFAKIGDAVPALQTIGNISTTYDGVARKHRVSEIQLSNNGGTGGLLDSASLDTDGLLFVRCLRQNNANGDTVSSSVRVFVFGLDIHMQATCGLGTLNKTSPFRT